MAKPTVDVNKIMQPLFKKYAVNVDLLESDAHRKSEVLKLRPAFNVDFNANNLMKWCKDNDISLSAVTIKNWMDKENTTVSPKATKTTSVNQWASQLAGASTEPQEQMHSITHAEWLFIDVAKNLMTEEQLEAAYNRVAELIDLEFEKERQARLAIRMQALTGRLPDHVFLREMKQFIGSDEYDQKGWGIFKRADKRRLIDMAEAGNEDAKEMVRDIDEDTRHEAPNTSPFEPAETEAEAEDVFKQRMNETIITGSLDVSEDEEKRLEGMAKTDKTAKELLAILHEGREKEAAAQEASSEPESDDKA
ncbi:hypothetical protein KLAF111653_24030 [Klebsiella africana]|uniref:Uncharacterized protein n=1 Tax=Klebsiella africana TaxID=2489010 RepID=A0A8B6IXD8_9ENTR|nr:hypothetical protein [Klebsiella africana]UDD38274.1 hypothetical protein LGL98_13580 [Klebsiella africana]VGQ13573.1 hypothetical protein SB5857_04775 [Klebsiella africana]